MASMGKHLLAGAGGTGNQNGGIGLGIFTGNALCCFQRPAVTDDTVEIIERGKNPVETFFIKIYLLSKILE